MAKQCVCERNDVEFEMAYAFLMKHELYHFICNQMGFLKFPDCLIAKMNSINLPGMSDFGWNQICAFRFIGILRYIYVTFG